MKYTVQQIKSKLGVVFASKLITRRLGSEFTSSYKIKCIKQIQSTSEVQPFISQALQHNEGKTGVRLMLKQCEICCFIIFLREK